MICRRRLQPHAVGGNLMSGAGKADLPDRALLVVTHYGNDRHS